MEELSPAVRYYLLVSASRQRLHEYTLGNLFLAVAAAAPCSPVQRLGPISLTISDAFHGRSQQPCTITHS